MSDVSHSGLPKARAKNRPVRTAEELTVEVEPGFNPFADLPDLPADPVDGPADNDPPGTSHPETATGAQTGSAAVTAPPGETDEAAADHTTGWATDPAADRGAARAAEPARREAPARQARRDNAGPGDEGNQAYPPGKAAGPDTGDSDGDSAGDWAGHAPLSGASPPLARPGPAPGVGQPAGPGRQASGQPSGQGADTLPPPSANRAATPDVAAAARLLGVPPALARLDVTVTVEVGRRRLQLAELVAGEAGSLIALDRLVDEPVDVLVNGTPFARGEIVALGDRFAVRLLALVEPGP